MENEDVVFFPTDECLKAQGPCIYILLCDADDALLDNYVEKLMLYPMTPETTEYTVHVVVKLHFLTI
jgi:hypothetical protein